MIGCDSYYVYGVAVEGGASGAASVSQSVRCFLFSEEKGERFVGRHASLNRGLHSGSVDPHGNKSE